MTTSTWTGAVSSDWHDADNWSPAGIPGVNSDVVIATGAPVALVSASIGTVNSITDSSDLSFESAGTNTVATTLGNTGHLSVDYNAGESGTILNIGQALTNSGDLVIGNRGLSASDEVTAAALDNTGKIQLTGSRAHQALLDISGSAGFGTAGVLSGHVQLSGDSAASSEITSLAARAELQLNGTDAFIEDSTALGSNSALTGLASISKGARLDLKNGAAVSTTGALANDGEILVYGSSLTAASLDNANTSTIDLTGSSVNQALLDVSGAAGFGAAGVLSGRFGLTGDSAIEFASGQLNAIAAGSVLGLDGNDAFVEDSGAAGSNSALTGLASIGAGAYLSLFNAASVSTTGALANHGGVTLENGASLTAAGALTNAGVLNLLGASDEVTAASLDNTGLINDPGQALLDVTTGVAGFGTAGVLSGSVQLAGAIEFAGGQINTIATGASLSLDGNDAFIEDSTALGSNSALTGLSDVAGSLNLTGPSVSTTGALTNNGGIVIADGSNLTVAGTLTNGGGMEIGNYALSASDDVTAKSFVNSGTVDLIGNTTYFAALNVSGAITNNGSISITTDAAELAGAVNGKGSFTLSNATLRFDSSVSARQTIAETGADGLTLEQAQKFAGRIRGFGTGDIIDAANFLFSGTSYNFVENSGGTAGTLTLHDAGLTANIHLTGGYTKSDFTLGPDSGTGTLVKFA
jgi:hypothetical protein